MLVVVGVVPVVNSSSGGGPGAVGGDDVEVVRQGCDTWWY